MKTISQLFSGALATASSSVISPIDKRPGVGVDEPNNMVAQSTITGTGAVTATVEIYGNLTRANSGGILIATHTLSGTTTDTKGGAISGCWPYVYAKITAITGTDAAINTYVCA